MPFSGDMETAWSADGLHMKVVSEIQYADAAGRLWTVPAGFVTDGASIPRALWSLIGSPFTGAYRLAAVFHDSAYGTLGVRKDDADRMLREASIELGCDRETADALYVGVRTPWALEAYAADQIAAAATIAAMKAVDEASQSMTFAQLSAAPDQT